MNRTIWLYWENRKLDKRPAYLDLCLETIRKHSQNFAVVVLNEKTVLEFLPDLRLEVKDMYKIAHRADYIRASLLYKYGGIWLDSDIILLQEINVEDKLRRYDFIGYGEEYGKPSIGFFAANKGCEILKFWIEGMDRKIDEKWKFKYKDVLYGFYLRALKKANCHFLEPEMQKIIRKLNRKNKYAWTELGFGVLWEILKECDYYQYDFNLFSPIKWQQWELFFREDIEPEDIINEDSIAVMMFNNLMLTALKDKGRDELLSSKVLLGKLFRYSLKKSHK